MNDVSRYIPHRPPMILIDAIDSYSEESVATTTRITLHSPFYSHADDGVPAWVGLEYMAQTAAVWVGLDDERYGRAVEPAFLVSARSFEAAVPVFTTGETLLTEVRVQLRDGEIVAFVGRIINGEGELRAEAQFTAYRPRNVQAYLQRQNPPPITEETGEPQ
jgi:predicted hotdog family 3-hydroxylacyl-ACP dehydratase